MLQYILAAAPTPSPVPRIQVNPNPKGLPGTNVLQQALDGLAFWGLMACVAGLVIGGITWALASHANNHQWSGRGRSGALIFIECESRDTTETLVIPAEDTRSVPRVVEPRRRGIEYRADHGDGAHAVSELATDRTGALSPFGDVTFPVSADELPYTHPVTVVNR